MNLDAILSLFQAERRQPQSQWEWLEILPRVTRGGSHIHGWANITFSDLDQSTADAAIQEQIEFFRSINEEFEWTVYGTDQPEDLKARLELQGFEIGPHEAIMVYDLQNALAPFDHDPKIRCERMTTLAEINLFRQVAEAVFDKDYSQTCGELTAALEAQSTGHLGYIAYDGETPVSIGRLYAGPNQPFAGFYGGGTLPSHRHRGFYRAMVAARAKDAMQIGSRYLRVDALPTSRPILERIGFAHLTDSWPCTWSRT